MLLQLRRQILFKICDPTYRPKWDRLTEQLDKINHLLDERLGEKRYAVRDERSMDSN